MTTALFPGRFDPVTYGHRDVGRRAAKLFDHVIVAPVDLTQGYLFSTEERVELLRETFADIKTIDVRPFAGLTVDFAKEVGATVIVRAMRAVTDFETEFDMALMNKKMAPEIESISTITSGILRAV